MSTTILSELSRYDDLALSAVIDYWKEYDSNKVLMAYALLKKRNYVFPSSLESKLEAFQLANGNLPVDSILENYFTQNEGTRRLLEDLPVNYREAPKTNSNTHDIKVSKYPALNIIITIYKVAAWIIGVAVILSAVIMLSVGSAFGGMNIISALGILLAGGLTVVGLIAISESIKVFIDIEYNTRKKEE